MTSNHKRPRVIDEQSESEYQTNGAATKRTKYDESESQPSDQESENEKGVKWTSLEHRGVTFFPGYVPHGVKILFKVSVVIN